MVDLSDLPYEQQLLHALYFVEPLVPPLETLNKDLICDLQVCETHGTPENSVHSLPETRQHIKWLYVQVMAFVCFQYPDSLCKHFSMSRWKPTLNILLFIRKDEDFTMTDIFNSSSGDHICQNIMLLKRFFVISIIRTKNKNIGSRLDTCCWIFYKTIVQDYLICSYMICYCSEKQLLKLYKQLWLLASVKNQILNNNLVSMVLQKMVYFCLVYSW